MKDAIFTFIRAVLWGALAGGGPFLLLTVPIVFTNSDWARPDEAILAAFLPFVIAGAVVAAATVCLGLPLTALLAFFEREKQNTYVLAGFLLGIVLPISLTYYLDGGASGVFFSLPGALAGSVTAAIWGGWREEVANKSAEPAGL